MKKAFCCSVLFFCMMSHVQAQPPEGWFKQYTFPQDYQIRTIQFADSLHGWAAGWKKTPEIHAVITHTTDAGQTWNDQLLETTPTTSGQLMPSGVYLAVLKSARIVERRKITFLK